MIFILFFIIISCHLFCFILKDKIKTLIFEEKYEKKKENIEEK